MDLDIKQNLLQQQVPSQLN